MIYVYSANWSIILFNETNQYGFLLPADQIIPTADEALITAITLANFIFDNEIATQGSDDSASNSLSSTMLIIVIVVPAAAVILAIVSILLLYKSVFIMIIDYEIA